MKALDGPAAARPVFEEAVALALVLAPAGDDRNSMSLLDACLSWLLGALEALEDHEAAETVRAQIEELERSLEQG